MDKHVRILHLEDDDNDAELVRSVLESGDLDIEIVRVDARREFESALACSGFDLIIADYSLPVFDGVSALAIARKDCPEVPYIFVSGNMG